MAPKINYISPTKVTSENMAACKWNIFPYVNSMLDMLTVKVLLNSKKSIIFDIRRKNNDTQNKYKLTTIGLREPSNRLPAEFLSFLAWLQTNSSPETDKGTFDFVNHKRFKSQIATYCRRSGTTSHLQWCRINAKCPLIPWNSIESGPT